MFKNFIHRFSDLLVVLLIVIIAGGLIFWRLDSIIKYPARMAAKGEAIATDGKDKDKGKTSDQGYDGYTGTKTSEPAVSTGEGGNGSKPVGATNTSGSVVEFEIAGGETLDSIANRLYEADLIGDATGFKNAVIESGKDRDIKMGYYEIPKAMSVDAIIALITSS